MWVYYSPHFSLSFLFCKETVWPQWSPRFLLALKYENSMKGHTVSQVAAGQFKYVFTFQTCFRSTLQSLKRPLNLSIKILKHELLFSTYKSVLFFFCKRPLSQNAIWDIFTSSFLSVETLLNTNRLEWVQIYPLVSNWHQNPKSL